MRSLQNCSFAIVFSVAQNNVNQERRQDEAQAGGVVVDLHPNDEHVGQSLHGVGERSYRRRRKPQQRGANVAGTCRCWLCLEYHSPAEWGLMAWSRPGV